MEVVTLDRVLFAGAAAVAVGGAVGVGLARQPLRAALALMAHLLGMAGLFLLLGAALVAVAQVLVYAGAVMVLFVFVIMILGRGNSGRGQAPPVRETTAPGAPSSRWLGGLAALGGVGLAGVIGFAVMGGSGDPPLRTTMPGTAPGSSYEVRATILSAVPGSAYEVRDVARALVVDYLVPFEVVSVLLLAVMVGVVVLARES